MEEVELMSISEHALVVKGLERRVLSPSGRMQWVARARVLRPSGLGNSDRSMCLDLTVCVDGEGGRKQREGEWVPDDGVHSGESLALTLGQGLKVRGVLGGEACRQRDARRSRWQPCWWEGNREEMEGQAGVQGTARSRERRLSSRNKAKAVRDRHRCHGGWEKRIHQTWSLAVGRGLGRRM